MSFVVLCFGLLGSWLLGTVLVVSLDALPTRGSSGQRPWRLPSEIWGLGLVLGIGLTSWLQFSWSLCGGTLGRRCSLALAVIGWLAAPVIWRLRRRRQQSVPESSALATLCRWTVGLLFLFALAQALLKPQHLWDERAIFAIKGIVLFEDQTIHAPELHDPLFVQGHPRYPLLIPLAEQHVYALLGEVNDRLAKIVFPLTYLGMLLTFAGVLSRCWNAAAGWLFAVLLGSIPALMPWEYGFLSGQADAPVACYHGIAVLYIWDSLRRGHESRREGEQAPSMARFPLIVAGIAAGMAAFTKDEGIAFLIVDTAALLLILSLWFRPNLAASLRSVVVFTAVALLVIGPWRWYRRSLPTTNEMAYFSRISVENLQSGLPTLPWSVQHLLQRLFREPRSWGLQWWGMVVMFVVAPRRAGLPQQLFLVLDVLGALAAIVVAGMLAPLSVEDHLGGSSHRFLMQVAPTALLFIAGQCLPQTSKPDGEEV